MIRRIEIDFTDNPSEIRNLGVGDYFVDDKGIHQFKIYCKDNSKKWINWAFACLFHELYEQRKTEIDGILEPDIDKFDAWHLLQHFSSEPGDCPLSPYRKQHREAENIERHIIDKLGEDWHEYFEKYLILEGNGKS